MLVFKTLLSISFQRWLYFICLCILLSLGSINFAQDTLGYTIALVQDRRLGTVTTDPTIGDSLSSLETELLNFGVQTITVDLREPIPSDVDLVILVRPLNKMEVIQIVYLWDYLQSGGNMLLALDPNGHAGVNTETSDGGILQLLDGDYGLKSMDNMLVEPWFDVIPLFDLTRSWTQGFADDLIPHPITDPLVFYDLPIRFWGARSLIVEPLSGIADTNALIITEHAHGEVSSFNLDSNQVNQFEMNVGQDEQGRLVLGGIAENYETGSRVAIIGDSEIFQNGFGQRSYPDRPELPLFVGDYLFSQRLIQWLIDMPETLWSTVPSGFTWIALNGQLDDWGQFSDLVITFADDIGEDVPLAYNILGVQMLHNDNFAYISVETIEAIESQTIVIIDLVISENQTQRLILENGLVYAVDDAGNREVIIDADYAVSENIEVRLPLRVVTTSPAMSQICIFDSTSNATDCYYGQISSTLIDTLDPVPIRFPISPMTFVPDFVLDDINLLDAPAGNFIVVLPAQTQLAILGRDELGEWIKVANGRYEGWVDATVVRSNARINLLPVIAP